MTKAAHLIQETAHSQSASVHHVRIRHRRLDISVARQSFHRPDIVALLEQMRRKVVSEGAATDAFGEPHRRPCLARSLLQSTLARVGGADLQGAVWSYYDVAIWPRPMQRPYPPVRLPITGSRESIEWAGKDNVPISRGERVGGLREDIIRAYAKALTIHGHRITPAHLNIGVITYLADSKAQAVKEYGPHFLYFNRTLFSHGNVTEADLLPSTGYVSDISRDNVRAENLRQAARLRRTSAT